MSAKTKQSKDMIARDGSNDSPWQAGISPLPIPEGSDKITNTIYDAVIIGGGITGITTALMLQQAGKQCVIAEAHTIGFGTTGGTSAHLNTFADTSYKEAESAFGAEGAKLFAAAINEGFDLIRENIKTYKIECDLEDKQGFVYAEDDKQADELQDLYDGTKKVAVPVAYTDDVPTPIAFKKALIFEGQAQFHPLKYLQALQQAYLDAGGIVLENTPIDNVTTTDGVHTAHSGAVSIKAKQVVYATHIPPGINIFSLRCAPYRSYVLGVTLKDHAYPDALLYDMQEPYHYFRTHKINGKLQLIAGGNDHKTGHDDPEKAFESLEKYIRKHYDVSAVNYKWSSQYYVPVDGFPYIGQMPGNTAGIYYATGYNGNGMMLGTIAAKILSDLILGNKSKYEDIFKPGRIKPIAGFKEFISENADVAYHFVTSQFSAHEVDYLNRVRKDTGKVVELDGKKIAVYRDADGAIHALSPVCTHAKCIVNWNDAEKSWDCPCHGARYDIDGKVLNGPADKDLAKVTIDEHNKVVDK